MTVAIEYSPTPKQQMFHSSIADEILYGGGAGGGKTVAIVKDAFFRTATYPGTTAVIFRRTFRELEDTDIKEALASYPKSVAKYNGGRHEFTLKNGSKILFRQCEHPADRFTYSGLEIQFLYFDELTEFEQVVYDFIKTRLRAKKSLGVVPIVRSASNPGGIGHSWVKSLFVDAAPYMEIVEQKVWSEAMHKERTIRTQYIPSLVMENPYITDDYIFQLEQKPEALRRALLNGDWDSFEGQVFKEFVNDPKHYEDRLYTHVIAPFTPPAFWTHYMAFDHGYSKPFAVQWWAVDPGGIAYLYKEWYGCRPGQANVGLEMTPVEIAEGILEREAEEIANNIRIDRIADPAIFDRSRGMSVADQMRPSATHGGVYFREADNTRLAGLMEFHERLRFRPDGRPGAYIMSNCKDWLRTVPNLPYSEKQGKKEDIDTDAEDHDYDTSRYFFMDIPLAPKLRKPTIPTSWSPYEKAGGRH